MVLPIDFGPCGRRPSVEGADAKASVALTETLVSQKRLACESPKD